MKFSYLICHSNTSSYRDNNLKCVIKYIRKNFENVEIIVAEQGTIKSNIDDIDIHVFYNHDGLFERSRLLNMAVKSSTNEKIVIADNDLIVDCLAITKSLDMLDEYDTVNPYNVVMDLPEYITQQYITTGDIQKITDQGTYRDSIVFAGGMLIINKSAYIKIGGYDENMIGWGGEDDILTIKILNLLKYISIESVSYHLFHDRGINGVPDHVNYENNLNILYRVNNMTHEALIEYAKESSNKFK